MLKEPMPVLAARKVAVPVTSSESRKHSLVRRTAQTAMKRVVSQAKALVIEPPARAERSALS
jgi:hypothetical protein